MLLGHRGPISERLHLQCSSHLLFLHNSYKRIHLFESQVRPSCLRWKASKPLVYFLGYWSWCTFCFIWLNKLGNQLAKTVLDAPRHTFARCFQHSMYVNYQRHFRLNQHSPRTIDQVMAICLWTNSVQHAGQPIGLTCIGWTNKQLCKVLPTLSDWKSSKSLLA